MHINCTTYQHTKVFSIFGEITLGCCPELYNNIFSQIYTNDSVVLDLSNVTYLSSAGIRKLLLLYRTIMNNGGQVVLVGLSNELQEMLHLTGFLEFFETHPTLDAGVQAIA